MIAEGQPASDFTLPDQDANTLTLSTLKGPTPHSLLRPARRDNGLHH